MPYEWTINMSFFMQRQPDFFIFFFRLGSKSRLGCNTGLPYIPPGLVKLTVPGGSHETLGNRYTSGRANLQRTISESCVAAKKNCPELK